MPQRWGVGSTQLHLDMERLALGVLLFDRIVLPTPSDLDEADRWDELGWDTEAQARRIVQLGELVHFAPWDKKLRDDWRARCNHIKEIGEATRNLAYAATPLTIALTAWNDVMTSVGPDYRPTVRPIPVMWASSLRPIVRGPAKGTAARDIGVEEKEPVKLSASSPYEEVSALRFRRVLEQPVRDAPEDTLDASLRLADSPEFQAARRTLYMAETLAAAGQLFNRGVRRQHGRGDNCLQSDCYGIRRRDSSPRGPPCHTALRRRGIGDHPCAGRCVCWALVGGVCPCPAATATSTPGT